LTLMATGPPLVEVEDVALNDPADVGENPK
jgi:hypothetical protein